jgi:hypothetical protein
MGIADRIRRLFSSNRPEEEAAEREELGQPARDDLDRPGQYQSFAGAEAIEVAEDELDEFKEPRDPAP